MERAYDNDCLLIAFAASLFAHLLLFIFMLFGFHFFTEKEKPAILYSVTVESSNLLGGIDQMPTSNQKTPIAPPKKTSAPQAKAEEPKPEPKVEEKKAEPVKNEVKEDTTDAEVSLAEKKKEEEKKKPEPKKPEPKKEPTKAPTKQPTPAPKKAAPAKPAVNNNNNNNNRGGRSTSADVDRGYQQAMQRYLGASMNAGGQGFGGDGRGGSGMGGGVFRPPEWFRYKELLEGHVKRGWKWHQPNSQLSASVAFRISVSGVVSDVRIMKSSGNYNYDQSVLRAVSKASPVPVPPAQFYEDFKFVEIDFMPDN